MNIISIIDIINIEVIQQETYYITLILKFIINSLVYFIKKTKSRSIPQQINFKGKLEEDNGATMFFIAKIQHKAIPTFFFKSIKYNRLIETTEHLKTLNLLREASDSRFTAKALNIINDQSNTNYSLENKLIYTTEVLKFDLCDYNYAHILVRSDVTIIGRNLATEKIQKLCTIIKCITKIDGTTIYRWC